MMDGWDMNGWGWAWMTTTMLIGTAVVVLVVILLYRGSQASGPVDRPENPLDILAQRFARGEINEEEYRGRRDVLQRLLESVR
jgi:putative membrane protein